MTVTVRTARLALLNATCIRSFSVVGTSGRSASSKRWSTCFRLFDSYTYTTVSQNTSVHSAMPNTWLKSCQRQRREGQTRTSDSRGGNSAGDIGKRPDRAMFTLLQSRRGRVVGQLVDEYDCFSIDQFVSVLIRDTGGESIALLTEVLNDLAMCR